MYSPFYFSLKQLLLQKCTNRKIHNTQNELEITANLSQSVETRSLENEKRNPIFLEAQLIRRIVPKPTRMARELKVGTKAIFRQPIRTLNFDCLITCACSCVHTSYCTVPKPGIPEYGFGHIKNGDFGAISVKEGSCAAPISKVERHISHISDL